MSQLSSGIAAAEHLGIPMSEVVRRDIVHFEVRGTPAPKGSSRAGRAGKGGRAILLPGGSKEYQERTQAWGEAVGDAARGVLGERDAPVFVRVALHVTITFRMRRPAGHWGKCGLLPSAARWPAVAPDIDKLTRATFDPMNGLVFDDDSRIARLTCSKVWAEPGREGASITVEAL